MSYHQAKLELEKKYELRETLGTGAFSEVKKAVNRETGDAVAIKIIDRAKCAGKEGMISSEIAILKKVKHENIIQLFELFETEAKIYLVMELVTGGELFDSIVARGHYTEVDAARIVEKILLAVDYLHSLGIAHRDLKPENLLFYDRAENSKIMISDFGLSKIFNDEEVMKTACGTPGYVAPEVLKRQGYGREVDLWSLGVITYILLCGYPPFYHENNQELFQQIMKGEFEFDSPHWDDISIEARDFISKLLVVDPKKRYDTAKALKHAFITKNCKPTTPKKVSPPTTVQTNISNTTEIVDHEPHAIKNLAHRVSENLRTRGMSVVRRRSVDVKGPRQTPYIPTHAPPEPKQKKSNEENSTTGAPLKQKKADSGVNINGSRSVDNSNEQVSSKPDDVTKQFLKQLSQVNKLIDSGNVTGAYVALQQIDCPHRLRVLYEEMIFNLPKSQKSSSQNNPSSVENDDEIDQEKFLEQLQKLVIKTRPSCAIIEQTEDQTSLFITTDEKTLPKVPVNSFETTIEKSTSNESSSEGAKFLQNILGSLLKKPEEAVRSEHSETKKFAISPPEQIKVLSLSLDIKPPGVKNNYSDYKDARVEYFCDQILPKYDIVCLQECFAFGSRRRERLLSRAAQAGFKSWICSPAKVFFSDGPHDEAIPLAIDGGLVILSRFSIVRSARMTFEKGVYADRLCAKGALYAGIIIPGPLGYQFIHVFNTNLQSSFDPEQFTCHNPSEPTTTARRHQTKALRSFIETQLQKELTSFESREVSSLSEINHECVLLMGNFNINGRKEAKDGSKHSDEYVILKKNLETADHQTGAPKQREFQITDIFYNEFGEHPITFGNVKDFISREPAESILTNRRLNNICASLDYMFQIQVQPGSSGYKARMPSQCFTVQQGSAKVEKFMVAPTSEQIMEAMESGALTQSKSETSQNSGTSATAPPATPMNQSKAGGIEPIAESKQVVFSNPSMPTFTTAPKKKASKMDMEKTLSTYKSELEAVQKEHAGISNSETSLASELSDLSAGSDKKPGVKELIDAKIGAMAAFFASDSNAKTAKPPKKPKFTQISDHYGLSVTLKLVDLNKAQN